LFGQRILNGDFIVLDLDDSYNKISFTVISNFDFDSKSIKWYAMIGYVGQDRINRLAKEGLLDQLTR